MTPGFWQAVFEGATLLGIVCNAFVTALFWRARATFATSVDMRALEDGVERRMGEMTKELSKKPDDQEIAAMYTRLSTAEIATSVAAADMRALGQQMTRVEYQLGLLVQYRMMEGAPK